MDKVVQQNAANAEESASASSGAIKAFQAPKKPGTASGPARMLEQKRGEIRPEQVIPFDDGEFKNF